MAREEEIGIHCCDFDKCLIKPSDSARLETKKNVKQIAYSSINLNFLFLRAERGNKVAEWLIKFVFFFPQCSSSITNISPRNNDCALNRRRQLSSRLLLISWPAHLIHGGGVPMDEVFCRTLVCGTRSAGDRSFMSTTRGSIGACLPIERRLMILIAFYPLRISDPCDRRLTSIIPTLLLHQ